MRAEFTLKCKDFPAEGQTLSGVLRIEGILLHPLRAGGPNHRWAPRHDQGHGTALASQLLVGSPMENASTKA